MLVNDLQVRKIHVALAGVAALLAVVWISAAVGAPAVDLVHYMGVSFARAYWILNAIVQVSSIAGLIAIIGGPLAMAVRAIGFWYLKRYIKRYGFRRAASL